MLEQQLKPQGVGTGGAQVRHRRRPLIDVLGNPHGHVTEPRPYPVSGEDPVDRQVL